MNLADLADLNLRLLEINRGRRPIPQKLHRAVLREAKSWVWEYRDTQRMRDFITKVSKPGYQPSVLELYLLREIVESNG